MNPNNTLNKGNSEFSLLLRCLGRHVMRSYPNKLNRQQFLNRYAQQHGSDALQKLTMIMDEEYNDFLRWSRALSLSPSYINLLRYFQEYSASTPLNSRFLSISPKHANIHPESGEMVPSSRPEWWSELPHLAPSNGGNYA